MTPSKTSRWMERKKNRATLGKRGLIGFSEGDEDDGLLTITYAVEKNHFLTVELEITDLHRLNRNIYRKIYSRRRCPGVRNF